MIPSRPVLAALLVGLLAIGCGTGTVSTATPPSMASPNAAGAPSASQSTSAAPSTAESPSDASATDAATGSAGTTDLACTAPATPTISATEGPYYRAGAPESSDLITEGMAGTRLTFRGYVVSTDCAPIANAKVEIWQADSNGQYDNAGYTLRGYVMTDSSGRFSIRTIVPGQYPGRTEHIHVKVTPPGGATLTTQMYFPGSSGNDRDGIYDPSLLLNITEGSEGLVGTYRFVLEV